MFYTLINWADNYAKLLCTIPYIGNALLYCSMTGGLFAGINLFIYSLLLSLILMNETINNFSSSKRPFRDFIYSLLFSISMICIFTFFGMFMGLLLGPGYIAYMLFCLLIGKPYSFMYMIGIIINIGKSIVEYLMV